MSIFSFFRGYRENKAKDKSIPKKEYKDNPYFVTKHAVLRMQERNINKGEVHVNLHSKPIKKTKVIKDNGGRPSYKRISDNKITTSINPKNKRVTTVHRLHTKDYEKIKKRR